MRKSNWNIKVNGRGIPVNEIYKKLLKSRGIDDVVDFVEPSDYHIVSGAEFKNIEKAISVFDTHFHCNSKFLIYADVDTDGCCSAAILTRYLRDDLNCRVTTFINNEKEHGVKDYFFDRKDQDEDIVIVVDSINEDVEMYERILQSGKDLIILDHHVPSEAVLKNQSRYNLVSSANEYVNPNLSGSGVCWKFIRYYDHCIGRNYSDKYADLAATGIIADVCSVGKDSMENRAICKIGFRNVTNPAIKQLVGKDIMNSKDIGFGVGPLINAANRGGANELVLQMLLSDNVTEVKSIIKDLTKIKEQQKKKTAELFEDMKNEAELQLNYHCMFFFPTDCGNLAGLLATKASDMWKRPAFVLHTSDDGYYRGSMRCNWNVDLRGIINNSGFGTCAGHETSAGVEIKQEDLQSLVDYLESIFDGIDVTVQRDVDLQIDRAQITPLLLRELEKLNFISGAGFPSISVFIDNINNYTVKKMSQGKHLCVETSDLKFLWWNFNSWNDVIEDGSMSAVGTLEESFFAGRKSTQVMLEDYNFTATPQQVSLW